MIQEHATFLANAHYREYLRLLRELHGLIREGRDETPEGETLRERMDRPGKNLSPEEVVSVNGVSADFYTLWEAPGELRVADTRTQSAAFRAALTARDAQQYDRALTLLRQCTSAVEPAGLAYARGTVWQAAGEPEMAALFFQRAAELDPNSIRDQAGQGIVRQEKLSGTATDR